MTNNTIAILWDLDGTIIDSSACHYSTWQNALENHGFTLDPAKYAANFGRNNLTNVPLFLGYEPEPAFSAMLIDEKESAFRERAPQESTVIPGVESWLLAAQSRGFPQAIASSGPLDNSETMLRAFNLLHYFDEIISGEHLPAKPEPDIFLVAATALGVEPSHCVVIEDSLPGVTAARNAAMTCIAITTTLPAGSLTLADFVVDDFTMPLDEVLADLGII